MTKKQQMSNGVNKKAIILIVIIVVVVIIGAFLGGGCYALKKYREYRAEHLAKDLAKKMGLEEPGETPGTSAKDSEEASEEGSKSAEKVFKETAELEAPEGLISEAHPSLESALAATFGGAKLSSYTTNYLGLDSGTAFAAYTIKREATVKDANALASNLKNNGYSIESSGTDYEMISISASRNRTQYTLSVGEGEQEVEVIMIQLAEEE